jgi:hypothetical protein
MHQQNGVAERFNQTTNSSLCMLFDAKLGKEFWAEAIGYAVYIKNRMPHKPLSDGKQTPYEMLLKRKSDISNIRRFRCWCYVAISSEMRTKLDPKAWSGIFVGCAEGSNQFRIYNPQKYRVEICRDVTFDGFGDTPSLYPEKIQNDYELIFESQYHEITEEKQGLLRRSQRTPKPRILFGDEPKQTESKNLPGTFADYALINNCDENPTDELQQENDDPTIYIQAMNDPDAEKWKAAINSETDSLLRNNKWIITDLPSDRKPITSKWVFKKKYDSYGKINRYKAHLVA